MKTIFVLKDRLLPNRKLEVVEKNVNGITVGQWIGYWNSERGTFNLYPNKHARYVSWPNKVIPTEKIVKNGYDMFRMTPDFKYRRLFPKPVKAK